MDIDHSRRWVTCSRAALSLLRKQHQYEVLDAREEDFFPQAVTEAMKIESSLDDPPSVAELASSANMSESHFRRSFKQCFGVAPQEFAV